MAIGNVLQWNSITDKLEDVPLRCITLKTFRSNNTVRWDTGVVVDTLIRSFRKFLRLPRKSFDNH